MEQAQSKESVGLETISIYKLRMLTNIERFSCRQGGVWHPYDHYIAWFVTELFGMQSSAETVISFGFSVSLPFYKPTVYKHVRKGCATKSAPYSILNLLK